MQTIEEYAIVSEQTTRELSNEVLIYIKYGYMPIGGIAVANTENGLVYLQAMIKYAK